MAMETAMKQYVVDAFSDRVFGGNPAAVCVMDSWLPDGTMRNIAMENNLSESAFVVPEEGGYHLRWFTPGEEIDLCGHATLASAFVLMNFVDKGRESVAFDTLSGKLTVERRGELYEMDFPAYNLEPVAVTARMTEAMGAEPKEAYRARDLLCVFDDEGAVRNMAPDMERVAALDGLLLHATARGRDTDCVSRSFAPKLGVSEDPVCGSGHCHIVPYWSRTLRKEDIVAYQASKRGGTLYCRMAGDRVRLAGKAALFSAGEIRIGE